jgi:ribonuclease VapC
MALALNEPVAPKVRQALASASEPLISAGTLTEALVVARRRGIGPNMDWVISQLGISVVPVTREGAELAADAYDRWGKGVHPAGLNIIDCFAYALAKERGCPLLFVGDDFAQTDVAAALPP